MSEKPASGAAKLGLVAALLLVAASSLVWDVVHRGPRDAAAGLPSSDRLLVVQLGGEPPPLRAVRDRGRDGPREARIGQSEGQQAEHEERRGLERRSESSRREVREGPLPLPRYQVKDGQCLYDIAVEVYGSGARWPEIARENELAEPYLLRRGQILRIPR